MREIEYRKRLQRLVGGWSSIYEPSRGAGLGAPDAQFLRRGLLVPVEVKRGEQRGGMVYPDTIRPSQISWLSSFRKAGGTAMIAICCGPLTEMDCWVMLKPDAPSMAAWKRGYHTGSLLPWVSKGKLDMDILGAIAEVALGPED